MSFEEAAALPVVYITAHHMLLYTGVLRAGMKVLLHSAAGGVGLAAIDLLRAHDCEIFGTASPSKHDAVRGFGVDHPIDYTSTDFAKEIRRIAGTDEPLESYEAFNYTHVYSAAGLPVAVVRVGEERGLPVGVQIVAPAFRDDVALAAAGALEQAFGAFRGAPLAASGAS